MSGVQPTQAEIKVQICSWHENDDYCPSEAVYASVKYCGCEPSLSCLEHGALLREWLADGDGVACAQCDENVVGIRSLGGVR